MKMSSRQDKYEICDIADLNEEPLDGVCDMVANYEAVLIYDIPAYERNIILKRCFTESVRTYITPKISDILLKGSDDIHLFDTPLYLSRNKGLSGDQLIFKRLLDLAISIPVAVILSPLFLVIALLIKLSENSQPDMFNKPALYMIVMERKFLPSVPEKQPTI